MYKSLLVALWILTASWIGGAANSVPVSQGFSPAKSVLVFASRMQAHHDDFQGQSAWRDTTVTGELPFLLQDTSPPLPSAPMKTPASLTPEPTTPVPTDTQTPPTLVPTSPAATATNTQAPPTFTPTSIAASATNTQTLPSQTPSSPTSIPTTATPEPAQVTLTGVEPKRITRESGGVLSIYGSGFVPGIAVRLVGYGLLEAAAVNSNAIRAAVPPNVPEGTYTLEIILGDGSILSLNKAVRIRSGEPEPTDTPTPGPALVYAQPQLLIESAETQPETIRPGSPFTLRLQLINRGDYTATNIRITVNSPDIAVPTSGSNLVVVDLLASNETRLVEVPLALNEEVVSGYNSLEIGLAYSDYYGRDYTSQQNVGLNAGQTFVDQPLVLLNAYRTTPAALSPGDAFILELEISNVGQKDAYQLLLTLGGKEGNGTYPFAIIDSGNVKFVPSLEAGGTIELEQRFILDGKAESGVYTLPVTLAYDNLAGDHLTESQVINLLASRRPQFQVSFYRPPGIAQVGESLELPIEVVNIGRNLVNVSTMQISGEDLSIEDGTSFVGALDGGTSGSIDALVVPEKSGTLPVVVTVNYLDDFNQAQQITQTLTIEVEQPAQPVGDQAVEPQSEQAETFWGRVLRFVRGLFGLGS